MGERLETEMMSERNKELSIERPEPRQLQNDTTVPRTTPHHAYTGSANSDRHDRALL
jgi:hypothetical protein